MEAPMTHFLSSDTNPNGYRLEDILSVIRRDLILRSTKIADDTRTEAKHVLDNNTQILQLLTQAIHLAEKSTHILDKSFGPSQSLHGGPPRIGVA
jgi:phosphoglycerate-specific signal transduction histidine kinase